MSYYVNLSCLSNDSLFFVSGNNIYKYDFASKNIQTVFLNDLPISKIILHEDVLFFSMKENYWDLFSFDYKKNELKRLTYFDKYVTPCFVEDEKLFFLSNYNAPFRRDLFLYSLDFLTNEIKELKIGPIEDVIKYKNDYYFQKNGYGYLFWREYKGGKSGKIYKNEKLLINLPSNCISPLIYNDRIYFIYDNKVGNLFSANLEGNDIIQHTFFEDFSIQNLSIYKNKISFSKLGLIYIFDIEKNAFEEIKLNFNPFKIKKIPLINLKNLTSIDSDGKDICIAARGSLYEGGLFSGPMINLNEELRFIHFYKMDKNRSFAVKEAPNSGIYIFENKKLLKKINIDDQKIIEIIYKNEKFAYINHNNSLVLYDFEKNIEKIIDHGMQIKYLQFSNCGNFLTYSLKELEFSCFKIKLYDITNDVSHELTNGRFNCFNSIFDAKNRFIAFQTDNNPSLFSDDMKFDYSFEQKTNIYIIPFKKNYNFLTPWVYKKEEDESEKDEKEEKDEKLIIDFDNIRNRLIKLPIDEEIVEIYSAEDDKILFEVIKKNEEKTEFTLKTFCLETLSEDIIFDNLKFCAISTDKKHAIHINNLDELKITKISAKDEVGYKKEAFDIKRIVNNKTIQQEWKNMFEEACFLMKSLYWSEKFAGLDIEVVFKKYEEAIERINSREELINILEQIQGEMGTSHAFVYDFQNYDKNKNGSLQCAYEYDFKVQKFKIQKIFNSNLHKEEFNPILQANVDIRENDYITKINEIEVNLDDNVEKLLQNQGKKYINIEIERDGVNKNFEILCANNFNSLAYSDFIEENRQFISKMTNNEVGYIHFSDMLEDGFKEFFEQVRFEREKNALIIDIRHNGGGNVSVLLIEHLLRKQIGFDISRNNYYTRPFEAFKGNYVLLISENTASDGEIFASLFREHNLGKIIGTRTWGGVVGIHVRFSLIDGTKVSHPEFAYWTKNDEYNIENHGVEPDIVIENNHMKEFSSENDLQLLKAIEIAKKFEKFDFVKEALKTPHHPIRTK